MSCLVLRGSAALEDTEYFLGVVREAKRRSLAVSPLEALECSKVFCWSYHLLLPYRALLFFLLAVFDLVSLLQATVFSCLLMRLCRVF